MASGLKHRTKAGYGTAEFGLSGAELLLQFYLFEFYTLVIGLDPGLTGLALALAVVWDAISDPAMGFVTDRTRGRFGRFLPWVFIGGFIYPVTLFALFNPPELATQAAQFAYLLVSYLLVNTATTIIGVPHMAMGSALSPDTDERTEVYGWRMVFGTFGFFLGILLPLAVSQSMGLNVEKAAELGTSRNIAALAMGVVVFLTAMVTVGSCRNVARDGANEATFTFADIVRNVKTVFANAIFLPLFFSFLLVAVARAMNATLALPYYKISLKLPEQAVQQYILGVFTVFIVISVPMWLFLSRRFGKKWPGFAGMLILGVMTIIVYPIFPAKSIAGPVIAAIIGGLAVGAVILFESMVTDAANADRLKDDENREGLYFGFWRMGQKLARSVGLAMTGFLTDLIGLNADALEQSEATARRLAWIFGPGVGLLFLGAALVFLKTPLTKKGQKRIQRRLEEEESEEKDSSG